MTEAPRGPGEEAVMSVSARLRTLSLTLAALMLLITAAGLIGLAQIRGAAETNLGIVGPAADSNRHIRDLMLEAQSSGRGYVVLPPGARSSQTGRELRDAFMRNRARVDAEQQALAEHIGSAAYGGDDQERLLALVGEQRQAVESWWVGAEPLVRRGATSPEQFDDGRRRFDHFMAVNDQVDTLVLARRQELRETARDVAVWTSWSVLAATLVAMAAALLVGRRTARQLTQPIVALRDTMTRHRAGDRDARADTGVGAAEVRQLAADVNALTAAYNTFLDEQLIASRAQNAETTTSRRIRDAAGVQKAVEETVVGIVEGLDLHRAAVATVDGTGALAHMTVCARGRDGAQTVTSFEIPDGVREQLGRTIAGLWEARRTVVVQPDDDDPGIRLLRGVLGTQGAGGLVIKPFGLGARPIGVIIASHDDADRRWYDSTVAAISQIAGEVVTHVVSTEVEAARAEHVRKLEDLDRQKNDFMSTVSHELRTPLTSITGYLEMLEDGDAGDLTDEQRAMLEVVDRNALRLRALIEDLLVLNRMEAAVTPSRGEKVEVGDLVVDTAEEMRPAAAKGEVDLRVRLPEASCEVLGDRLQLGRALTNLVSNAIKFTPKGGRVDLEVSRIVDDGTPAVQVRCSDTGIGIPAEDQERLFTRFFRARNATSAQVPGTGLGLVVVQGIVERHHGRLEVESVEGSGTTVRMVIPLHPDARSAAAPGEAAHLA